MRLGRAAGPRARQQQLKASKLAGEDVAVATESAGLDVGGATTTFEERTVWNLTDVSFCLIVLSPFMCFDLAFFYSAGGVGTWLRVLFSIHRAMTELWVIS